jgi:hypothetical protein
MATARTLRALAADVASDIRDGHCPTHFCPNDRWWQVACASNIGATSLHPAGQEQEQTMANDADWVADVRRWVTAGAQSADTSLAGSADSEAGEALGYEAAHPALQAAHWPDAPDLPLSDPI